MRIQKEVKSIDFIPAEGKPDELTVHITEVEKIDVGRPDQVSNSLNSLRWDRKIVYFLGTGLALISTIDGVSRIGNSLSSQATSLDIQTAALGAVEGMAGILLSFYSAKEWCQEINIIDPVRSRWATRLNLLNLNKRM